MGQLLSNIEVILLNIVDGKPSYAYEIDKTIDLREMKRWVRVGVASIYRVLIKLEEKGFVYSQNEKEGRMPERKRYYITASGRVALVEVSKRLLSNLEWYYMDLNVGLEACNLLSPVEVSSCLKKRLAKVKANIKGMEEICANVEDLEKKKRIIIKNLIYLRGAEKRILEDVIKKIGIDE
ncbi:MAG: PadR family transcriptional regulator [Desulfotomaculaceae bacterium]|nr:PadR family transcriptional regulator [Desulfotomaculaceae bacterium]